ncbi:hypothetical protein WMF20_30170 [Sorangium sp. So ce834]|uniref:hypothetical protein n=1 Tax=Sorangium sp. So ce834 TaxID=3133321 RepID=UPI003F60204B
MGLLSHDEILAIHRAATSTRLDQHRSALLAGLDERFVAGLPRGESPSAQILNDLHTLNAAQTLADQGVPLTCWLSNAIALTEPREEAAVFRTALGKIQETLGRRRAQPTAPDRQSHGSPPTMAPRAGWVPIAGAMTLGVAIAAATALWGIRSGWQESSARGEPDAAAVPAGASSRAAELGAAPVTSAPRPSPSGEPGSGAGSADATASASTVDIQVWSRLGLAGKPRLITPGARLDPREYLYIDLRADRRTWVYLFVDTFKGERCDRILAPDGVAEILPGVITELPQRRPGTKNRPYYPLKDTHVKELLHFLLTRAPIPEPERFVGSCRVAPPREIPKLLTRTLGQPTTVAEASARRDHARPWPASTIPEWLQLATTDTSVFSFDFVH